MPILLRMKYFYWISAWLLLCTSSACTLNDVKGSKKLSHFSTAQYFTHLADSLSGTTVALVKTASINGKTAIDTFLIQQDTTFWQREFDAFIQADIDKPAMRGAYQLDTVQTETILGETYKTVHYYTDHEDLKTKSLRVQYTPSGKVAWLRMEVADTNVIYRTRQVLRYSPDTGYVVKAAQEVVAQPAESYAIKVKWLTQK